MNLTITHLDDNNKNDTTRTPRDGREDKTIPVGLAYNALVDPEADIVMTNLSGIAQRPQNSFRASQITDAINSYGNSPEPSDRVSDHAAEDASVVFDSSGEFAQLGHEASDADELDLDFDMVPRKDLPLITDSFEDALLHAGVTQTTETTVPATQDKRNKLLLHGMVSIVLPNIYTTQLANYNEPFSCAHHTLTNDQEQ